MQLEKDYAMKAEVLRVREKETLARLERERQVRAQDLTSSLNMQDGNY